MASPHPLSPQPNHRTTHATAPSDDRRKYAANMRWLVCPSRRSYRRIVGTSSARWRPKWLPSLHDRGPLRLWRIGYALAACVAVAAAGLAALWLAAQALLGHPQLRHSSAI